MLQTLLKGLPTRLSACVFALALIGLYGASGDAPSVQAQEKAKADVDTDALPPGALARLGTLRWRHGDTVSYVAFPPDGKSVLSASIDNVIRLWDRETGKEVRRFAAPLAAQPGVGKGVRIVGSVRGFSGIAISPDGQRLAALIATNVVQVWETSTGKDLRQLKTPVNGAAALLFAPDNKTLAIRTSNRTIHLIDSDNGNEIRQLQIAPKQVGGVNAVFVIGFNGQGDATAFAFAPDGKTVAVSETMYDNRMVTTSVKQVNVADGKVIRTLPAASQGVNAVAYSRDGKMLAHTNANAIKLIDPDTGKDIRTINAPMGASMLVFSPDGKTLAAKGRDQLTRLYDTETGNEMRQFGQAPAGVNPNQPVFINYGAPDLRDLAFAPDGKTLAIGGGQVLRFFEVGTGKELPMAGGHRGNVTAVAVSADGKTILSRGADNVVRRWDAATGNELGQFETPKGTTCAAFSADLRLAAFGKADATISIVDVATGKEIHQQMTHPNGAAVLAFSPNGKLLASRGNRGRAIRIFDVAKGTEVKHIALLADELADPNVAVFIRAGMYNTGGLGLAFSSDGQSIAANVNMNNNARVVGGQIQPAGGGNTLRIYDVATGKETRQIQTPQFAITSLAFPPGGRVIAAECSDQTVVLWEIASGQIRAKIGAPVAIAGMSGGAFVGGGFAMINRFGAQPQSCTMAFSRDGLLAAKGPDHAVKIYDLPRGGAEIANFKGHQGPLSSLAFAPNGKTLVSGSNDTTMLVWDIAKLKRGPAPQAFELQPKEVEALWTDLIRNDGARAQDSIAKLALAPKEAVPFLGEHLKPATPVDPTKIDRWIADLDSTNFKVRGTAAVELEKLGELAVPALKKVLGTSTSLETRRRVEPMMERLTGGVLTAEQIRLTRAIEVLEQIGTPEARQLLKTLSKGAPGAYITRQAQIALDGLVTRPQ